MTNFVNNDVSSGAVVYASDHNTQGALIASVLNGNIDNANIASSAAIATSKLADDNGIGAAKLSSSAIKLGYVQRTTDFTTTSTTDVQVTGLSATVTIPAGGRSIKITTWTRGVNISSGAPAYISVSIWDGTVGSGTKLSEDSTYLSSTSSEASSSVMAVVTPSAGSKTYNVGIRTTAGTALFEGRSSSPAFILVEAI